MRRNPYFFTAFVVLFSFGVVSNTRAQSPSTVLNDYVLGGTGGKIEHINQINAGLNLTIPVVRIRGRGIDFTYVLNYSNRFWYTEPVGFPPYFPYVDYWRYRPPWGVNGSNAGSNPGSLIVDTCETPNGTEEIWVYDMNLSVGFQDGSAKQFPTAEMIMPYLACYQPVPYSNYLETYASDLSSIFFKRDYGIVKAPDGSQPNLADANGNYLSLVGNTYYDSVGRAVVTQTIGAGGYPTQLTLADGRVIGLVWSTISMTTSFPSGVNCSNCPVEVLTRINLPNGRYWAFEYASNSFGQLTKIILPSGGYIRYTYALLNYYVDDLQVHSVTGRYESADGVTENGWTYSYVNPAGGGGDVTMTDPNGDVTFTTFRGVGMGLQEIDVEQRQGATQVLTKTHKDWACDQVPYSTYADVGFVVVDIRPGNCRVTDVTTTIYDGASSKTKKVHYDYDQSLNYTYPLPIYPQPFGPPRFTNYTTSYGNVTGILEYDWGTGSTPGPLIRQTENTYLTANPANGWINYLAPSVHIVNKPTLQVVKDAQGNILAQTEYEYDGSTLTVTSGVPKHDYTLYPASNRKRGNVTKVKKWRNTDSVWLTTTNTYNDLGNLLTTTDPGGHIVSLSYTDDYSDSINRNTQAYVTQVTFPQTAGINHIERQRYYYNTGLLYQEIDQNNQTATYTYDNMNRLASVSLPDGGQTTYSFNDPTNPSKLTTTTKITATSNLITETEFDKLGRVRKTKLVSDPQGAVYTLTEYDGLGRKLRDWNPTRCDFVTSPYSCPGEPTFGRTEYEYDALGRTAKVIPPDGTTASNNVTTSYSLNLTTVSDQAGKKRKSETDVLGRLLRVWEPDAAQNLVHLTRYQYDVLDNLLCVHQKSTDATADKACSDATVPATWRPRKYAYNSLSQLTQAINPESGTQNYSYDSDGNLATKTDARGIVVNYSPAESPIDALHRVTKKTYSNGDPAATFTYDVSSIDGLSIQKPIGRLVKSAQGSTRTLNSYDVMGRVKDQWQCTPLNCGTGWYQLTHTYNLAGGLTSYTDGAGHTFTQAFNAAARLTALTSSLNDAQHPGTLASSLSYNAAGAIAQMTYGNGLTETRTYNNRLQPTQISVGSLFGSLWAMNYTFADAQGKNNGNVQSWSGTGWQSFTRSYTYDELNRLKTMADTQCNYTWNYDIWANRTAQDATGGTGPCGEHFPIITSDNRVTGLGYDLAGNVTSDGSTTYQWDGEGRMKSMNGGGTNPEYTYDANGRRVRKKASGVTTEYVYGLGGSVASEFQGTTWTKGYVYLGGQLLAQYSNGTTHFAHKDHLGTTRVLSNVSGGNYEAYDYWPFGDTPSSQGTGTTHKFTGKERDGESGLDYLGVRYMSSGYGRFMSPDSIANDWDLWNPQTWNRYTYARNNPLIYIDPDGAAVELIGETEEERTRAVEEIKKGLSKDAASRVYINEVKDGDKTRYFVGIQGDLGDFAKMGSSARDLADLVGARQVVEFGVTNQDLPGEGANQAGYTYAPGQIGNQNVRVLINTSRIAKSNEFLQRTILGALKFEPGKIRSLDANIIAWHEFGHAWKIWQNQRAASNSTIPNSHRIPADQMIGNEALNWENRMREQRYGPLGTNNAKRISH